MVGPDTARAIALISGAGGTGRTTAARGLAQALAKRKIVLLFDMCFGWGGLSLDHENLPTYQKLLELDDENLIIHSEQGFDLLTCEPPDFLDPTIEDLKRIAWLANEFSQKYDVIIFDSPSGAHPLALLSAGMSEQVLLFSRPEAASVASSYCLLKSLFSEGIYSRVKIVFSQVDSPEQAASLKTRFDIMTSQFLGFKVSDGGYLYRREGDSMDDFSMIDFGEESEGSIKNLNLDVSKLFQNETDSSPFNMAFPNSLRVRR